MSRGLHFGYLLLDNQSSSPPAKERNIHNRRTFLCPAFDQSLIILCPLFPIIPQPLVQASCLQAFSITPAPVLAISYSVKHVLKEDIEAVVSKPLESSLQFKRVRVKGKVVVVVEDNVGRRQA